MLAIVTNAEFAQSYIDQANICFLSFKDYLLRNESHVGLEDIGQLAVSTLVFMQTFIDGLCEVPANIFYSCDRFRCS